MILTLGLLVAVVLAVVALALGRARDLVAWSALVGFGALLLVHLGAL